jgi:uncharacterized phage-like protein YoqJ
MKQTITIGVTGHRDIIETKELHEKVVALFTDISTKYPNYKIKLLSPLADGADRYVAKIFLELKKRYPKWELIVPMPFHKKRYMEDFNEISKKEFLNYLNMATETYKVKNIENDNYKSLGYHIVENSHTLLALWDGTFNHKSGGTGDVVNYAKNRRKDIVHFYCERKEDRDLK